MVWQHPSMKKRKLFYYPQWKIEEKSRLDVDDENGEGTDQV